MKSVQNLNSGITLITDKSVKTSTVTFCIYFKIGSAYESGKKAGITNLTMNMFFRRMGNLHQSDLYSSMEKLGGEIKGIVSKDYTCFTYSVLSCFAERALNLILMIFDETVWKDEDFEIEKKIALKKIEYAGDGYDYCLLKQTGLTSYIRDIKGTDESVGGITLTEVNKWKSKYFVPSNACMVITGNFDENIKKECEAALEKLESTSAPGKKLLIPSEAFSRNPEHYIIRKSDYDPAEIRLFFDVNLKKINLTEFLTAINILGLGVGGKLPYCLKDVNALTDCVDFDTYYVEDYAIIDIDFYVNSSDVKEALNIISKCISEMKNEITRDILDTGILFNTLNETVNNDTSEALADLYGHYDFILNKPYSVGESASAKENITPESIMELSKELFRPENMFVCVRSKQKISDTKKYIMEFCNSL